MDIITYKGVWLTANRFLIDKGEEIRVSPYPMTLKKYGHLIGKECYIQIITEGKFNILANVMEV